MSIFIPRVSFVCFDGDDDAAAAAAKAAEEAAAKKAAEEKTFTQEEVNTYLAKEKRKTQEAQRNLATQLEDAKSSSKLSQDDRDDLEKQIEVLQKQYMTGEERARQASEKMSKKHDEEFKLAQSDRDGWKVRYTEAVIDSAIIGAASVNKAVSPVQIAAMLKPATKLTEKLDDEGKPMGSYEPRVTFMDTDKDDKPVELDLTIPEAVKRMAELEQYGNLFEGSKVGGLGGRSGTKGRTVDIAKIAVEDPALYRKLRKEQPELFAQM